MISFHENVEEIIVKILRRLFLQSKAYREYLSEKKDMNLLTEEDKFLLQLSRIERLQTKLSIMSFMGNYLDNVHLIAPVSFLVYLCVCVCVCVCVYIYIPTHACGRLALFE